MINRTICLRYIARGQFVKCQMENHSSDVDPVTNQSNMQYPSQRHETNGALVTS